MQEDADRVSQQQIDMPSSCDVLVCSLHILKVEGCFLEPYLDGKAVQVYYTSSDTF